MIDFRPCRVTHLTTAKEVIKTDKYIQMILSKYPNAASTVIKTIIDNDFKKKRVNTIIILKMIIFMCFFLVPLASCIFMEDIELKEFLNYLTIA